jgi:hypothetical protein
MKLLPEQVVYVRSMGKALRITAIFGDDAGANAHMEKHSNEAVVACFGHLVFLANVYDRGTRIEL